MSNGIIRFLSDTRQLSPRLYAICGQCRPDSGLVITYHDDEGAEQLRAHGYSRGPDWITYGLDPNGDLQATELQAIEGSGYQARFSNWQMPAGALSLEVPENTMCAMRLLPLPRRFGATYPLPMPAMPCTPIAALHAASNNMARSAA